MGASKLRWRHPPKNSAPYKDKDEVKVLLDGSVQIPAPSLVRSEELGIKEFKEGTALGYKF